MKFIEGTGLGLAITRKLITLMDGRLRVDSKINKGSTFSIKLNLPIIHDIQNNNQQRYNIKGYQGERINIVAVDDNLTNLSFLISTLEPLGFILHTAQNGKQAIQEVLHHKPALILMDLVMPQMNGTDAIRTIKAHPETKACKFIGITASVIERKDRIEFITQCDGHIDKPVDVNELLAIIKQLLSIEWIKEDVLELAEPKANKTGIEPLQIPDNTICNAIIEYAEIGDFESLENILVRLETENLKFQVFCNTIQNYISTYNSERIINYIHKLNT